MSACHDDGQSCLVWRTSEFHGGRLFPLSDGCYRRRWKLFCISFWRQQPTRNHPLMSSLCFRRFSNPSRMPLCHAKEEILRSKPHKLRFTSGNTTETLRYYEENFGRPWNEIEVKYPPDAPNGDCMVACIIWSEHPAAENEYIINVSEFLMYAGLETLFLGPKDKDSHTILFCTFRPTRTTAKERRQYVPYHVKQERLRNRKARQEANRLKGKAKGTSKGQGPASEL